MRGSGILMHISSLPSKYGIGTLGAKAYEFVDLLSNMGQKYWQVLPMGPTSYGDSPYQSPSAFAGNPYFIDLDFLIEDGLLVPEDIRALAYTRHSNKVDYGELYDSRNKLFNVICDNFSDDKTSGYSEFCENNSYWLDDYALFMAIKEAENGRAWSDFSDELKHRKSAALAKAKKTLAGTIRKHKILQFLFYRQWYAVKSYANLKGIKIIGDIPIYVAMDSCDVWCHPKVFSLDRELRPIAVAGCPPDYFSPLGQLWGNPLYDWQNAKKNNAIYEWWKSRISFCMKLFDVIRIDHFRGFAEYYSIPANNTTAENGTWEKGPGKEFFNSLKQDIGELPIIAEDLGFITDGVKDLLRDTGFPGMKVLQFAFGGGADNEYLPHNYDKNCVVYLGTHDNDTTIGWLSTASGEVLEHINKYLPTKDDSVAWSLIRLAMSSSADTVILTIQDILSIGGEGRMNAPSTDRGNWSFRVHEGYINDIPIEKIKNMVEIYGR